jgi:type IV pilus assembly protein PilB
MKTNTVTRSKRLGEILVEQGRISPEQLTEALRRQRVNSKPLGQILVQEGFLTEEELTDSLGEQLGIPHVWLRKGLVDPQIVHILPKEKALRLQVIPMFRVNNVLTLGVADPLAYFVFDEVSKITNLEVQPVICRVDDIENAINECYREDVNIDEVMSSFDESAIELVQATTEREISEIAEMADASPVISLTNSILLKAIREGASDIHIEPQRGRFRVRARIDGVLYELMSPKLEMHAAVVSRLKVMANLDIAERRIPQDGRMQVNVDGRIVDLRFSSMPGMYGERLVLRILDKANCILDINKLGFESDMLKVYKSLITRPYGLVLVCGPTGSGKTTTLYSTIAMLNSLEKNIITIEDPVEYELENVSQTQVRDGIGFTFARFLKHGLRQDPDIILVGEIRDRETAETAIQASLTGHLVFSTLHTNDSVSAITRLMEMGIEPYLISSSLLVCLAQRLLRLNCPECVIHYFASEGELKELGIDEDKKTRLFKGKGCSGCFDSGFKGRTGIFEILKIDEDLRSLILQNPGVDTFQAHLRKQAHRTLKELGHEKVIAGDTSLQELRRVTSVEG